MQSSLEELDRFSALLQKIYDGAIFPQVWPDTLREIADWLAVPKALLFTPLNAHEHSGFFFSHGVDERFLELYRTKYHALDVWAAAGRRLNVYQDNRIVLGTELVPEKEYRASRIYKEFHRPQDTVRLMVGTIFGEQAKDMVPTVCSILRGEDDDEFGHEDRIKFGLVLQHLSRSFGVMYRLREADIRIAASLGALDRLPTGVLLIAPPGEVVFANRAANELLEQDDGLRLQPLYGRSARRLLAAQAGTQTLLDEAMRQAMTNDLLEIPHFSRSIPIRRPSGRPDYAIQFSMLTEKNEFGQGIATPRAIAFITDPSAAPAPEPEQLIELYRLTPAEARLAIALANGDGLQEVAGQIGISLNTAKTQLQSIYGKTGTDNRAKLTKLLFALARR